MWSGTSCQFGILHSLRSLDLHIIGFADIFRITSYYFKSVRCVQCTPVYTNIKHIIFHNLGRCSWTTTGAAIWFDLHTVTFTARVEWQYRVTKWNNILSKYYLIYNYYRIGGLAYFSWICTNCNSYTLYSWKFIE